MKNNIKLFRLIPLAAATVPFFAFAADIGSILSKVKEIVGIVIPLLMTIAILVFIYGVVKYITAGGDAAKEKEARRAIIAGLIGLFVLVAFWALVNVLINTFGLTDTGPVMKPTTSF